MKLLRDYQIEAVNTVNAKLNQYIKRQILVLATGLGKTVTAATIVNQYKKALWITHTEELILQSAKALMEYNSNVGIIKAERFDIDKEIVVASIQTLWRRLDKIDPNTFDIIVIDECHFAAAKTWTKAINHFYPTLLLGLTATPHRADGMPLGDIFDEIVYERDIKWGIDNNYLCELDAIRVKTELSLDDVRVTAGELNQKDLAMVNNPYRNQLIVDKYKEYCDGLPCLVFCVDVEHAIELSRCFSKAGYNSTFVVGDEKLCPDRKERIEAFKNNEVQIVTNVMVLTAGFDYPEIQCIIMARPTKSLTVYLQAIGRGTRLKKKAKKCTILDVVDISKKHNLVNTWSLDDGKAIEDQVFKTKEKKLEELEKQKRETEVAGKIAKDVKVDLFKIPKIKVINSYRMQEPATEKQLEWIKALGYDIENVNYTKAMCNAIISNLPATDAQIESIRNMGYDVNKPITRAEAQACFNENAQKVFDLAKEKLFRGL